LRPLCSVKTPNSSNSDKKDVSRGDIRKAGAQQRKRKKRDGGTGEGGKRLEAGGGSRAGLEQKKAKKKQKWPGD